MDSQAQSIEERETGRCDQDERALKLVSRTVTPGDSEFDSWTGTGTGYAELNSPSESKSPAGPVGSYT